MKPIVLKNESFEATFLPDRGMNLISFKKGNIEVIDQSTKQDFEERFAGLGPIIGPHFHRRNPRIIPPIKNKDMFPHIEKMQADPFSHGIGRYAPWQTEVTDTQVHAQLSGDDTWNDIKLSELEGQKFKMEFNADLTPEGLKLEMSVVSDTDSIVGIHYYYHLPQGTGKIISTVQNKYIVNNELKPLPDNWNFDAQHKLTYDLDQDTDFTFFPHPNPLEGKILLDTGVYQLMTRYTCASQENSWQLWHPKGASFVCVEPLSSQNPRRPNLTVSSIKIHLQIL